MRSAEAAAISSPETRAAESMAQQQQQLQVRVAGTRFAARPSSLIASPSSSPTISRPSSATCLQTAGSNGSRTLPSSPALAKRESLDTNAQCGAGGSRLISQPGAMRRRAMLNNASANASTLRSTLEARSLATGTATGEQLEFAELPVDASLLIARPRATGAPPPPARRTSGNPAPLNSQRDASSQPAFPLTSALPAIARTKPSRLHDPNTVITLYGLFTKLLLFMFMYDYSYSFNTDT